MAKAREDERMPEMVQIPLDTTDKERLAKYLRRERARGRRLRPGPAAGYLFRRGLDVEESEARAPGVRS